MLSWAELSWAVCMFGWNGCKTSLKTCYKKQAAFIRMKDYEYKICSLIILFFLCKMNDHHTSTYFVVRMKDVQLFCLACHTYRMNPTRKVRRRLLNDPCFVHRSQNDNRHRLFSGTKDWAIFIFACLVINKDSGLHIQFVLWFGILSRRNLSFYEKSLGRYLTQIFCFTEGQYLTQIKFQNVR